MKNKCFATIMTISLLLSSSLALAAPAAEDTSTAAEASAATADAAPPATLPPTDPVAPTVSMPNPMVSYNSIPDMVSVLGFYPLYIPRYLGYDCSEMYIIANCVADLRFSSRSTDSELTIRTAFQEKVQRDDISGYYGVDWKNHLLSHTAVNTGTLDGTHVAYWSQNRYVFAVSATQVDDDTFMQYLTHLVEITEWNYMQ